MMVDQASDQRHRKFPFRPQIVASKNKTVGNGQEEGAKTGCEQKRPEVTAIFRSADGGESALRDPLRILQGAILEIN